MHSLNSFHQRLQKLKSHIVFKIATLTLVLALLTPTVLKFAHTFNHHEHEICKGEHQVHLHATDFDCSYHKFKLTNTFTIPEFSFDILSPEKGHKTIISQYFILSEFQRQHVLLRGPPQFNLI